MPEDFANSVFNGKDSEMPTGTDFEIAIDYKDKEAPKSIKEALQQMNKVLPNWYKNAIYTSKGDNECSVNVNDISYPTTVVNFFWLKWGMDEEKSKLRKEFGLIGINSKDIIQQSINNGFCIYIKSGREEKAIEEIKKYRKLEIN